MNESFEIASVRDANLATRLIENSLLEEQRYLFELKPYEKNRTNAQNKLQWHWMNELDRQSSSIPELNGMDINQIQAMCKLRWGVQIMNEDDDFRQAWPLACRGLNYEEKLVMIEFLPVTRLMNIEQKTRYLTAIYYHFSPLGAILTTSADFYFEAMGWKR